MLFLLKFNVYETKDGVIGDKTKKTTIKVINATRRKERRGWETFGVFTDALRTSERQKRKFIPLKNQKEAKSVIYPQEMGRARKKNRNFITSKVLIRRRRIVT